MRARARVCMAEHRQVSRDNALVYYEKAPAASLLPPIDAKVLAKPSAVATLLEGAGNVPLHAEPSTLFAAALFLTGAFAGMGGMFLMQRVHAEPRSKVLRASLAKPLLVAKVDEKSVEGTEAAPLRNLYVAPTA